MLAVKDWALDDLPEELLSRILTGAGLRTILRAAACCKRLQAAATSLQSHRCFSAAASVNRNLVPALIEACDRALEGMLGRVDFVLVFVTSSYHGVKGSLAARVAEVLLQRLPPGTQLVGCTTAGLMGVDSNGDAFEVDPGVKFRAPSVALLLGNLPGCRVRAFCNIPPKHFEYASKPGRRIKSQHQATNNANNAVIDWLLTNGSAATAKSGVADRGLYAAAEKGNGGGGGCGDGGADQSATAVATATATSAAATTDVAAAAAAAAACRSSRSLGLQSVWIMRRDIRAAAELLEGPGGLLRWLQADVQDRPVVAGGVAPRGEELFFHPGWRRGAASAPAGAAVSEAREDVDTGLGGSSRYGGGGSGSSSGRASLSLSVLEHVVARRVLCVGLAVMTDEAAAAPGTTPAAATAAGGGSDGAITAAEALQGHGGADAAIVGSGPSSSSLTSISSPAWAPSASAMRGGPVPPPPGSAVRATAPEPSPAAVRACAMAMRGHGAVRGCRVHAGVSMSRVATLMDEGEDGEETGARMLVTTPGSSSLVRELLQMQWERGSGDVAVWAAHRHDHSIQRGLDIELLRSRQVAIGSVADITAQDVTHRFSFDSSDLKALVGIMEGAKAPGATLCCQAVHVTSEGCRVHLQAELPVLRSVCSPSPLQPGGPPDPRSWEGYEVLRRAAARAGARAGPMAMVVFSCIGRGRAVFGEDATDCEARIADQVLHGEIPFIGAYGNGELGPYVRNNYVGWFFDPVYILMHMSDAARAGSGSAAAAAAAAAVGAASASRGLAAVVETGPAAAVAPDNVEPLPSVVVGGRVIPLTCSQMQGYTSVYAVLG